MANSFNIAQLNKAFESRIRLGIMSVLMVNDQVDFNTMKELLNLTDGNLASHISALEKLEYVLVHKNFIGKKPHTVFEASKLGKAEFKVHLNALEKLLKS